MSERAANERLWLHEQVLLVALHDEKGSVQSSSTCGLAMGGAILADLSLLGRVRVVPEKKKDVVVVDDATPTGAAIVDECLEMVSSSSRRRRAEDWVGRFARVKGLRERTADDLVSLGALRREEGRVLIVFPVTRWPEADASYEAEIDRRLGEAIFGEGAVEEARTATLVALLDAAQMLPLVFPKKELKERKGRIEAVVSGDASGEAVTAAVRAMQAAVVAACAASAAAAAAAS